MKMHDRFYSRREEKEDNLTCFLSTIQSRLSRKHPVESRLFFRSLKFCREGEGQIYPQQEESANGEGCRSQLHLSLTHMMLTWIAQEASFRRMEPLKEMERRDIKKFNTQDCPCRACTEHHLKYTNRKQSIAVSIYVLSLSFCQFTGELLQKITQQDHSRAYLRFHLKHNHPLTIYQTGAPIGHQRWTGWSSPT